MQKMQKISEQGKQLIVANNSRFCCPRPTKTSPNSINTLEIRVINNQRESFANTEIEGASTLPKILTPGVKSTGK